MYTIKPYHFFLFLLFAFVWGCKTEPKKVSNTNKYGLPDTPNYCTPKTYSVQQFAQTPVIDGIIDDQAWNNIHWSAPLVSELKNGSSELAYTTKYKLGRTEDSLYFSAVVSDQHISAVEDICQSYFFDDNFVELYIDANGDEFDYAVLKVNALGVFCGEYWKRDQIKPIMRFSLLENQRARCSIHIQGTVNNPHDLDDFWSVECAIPTNLKIDSFQVLSPHPIWNVNVQRKQWPTTIVAGLYKKLLNPDTGKKYPGEQWVWSFMNECNIHTPELWGKWILDPSRQNSANLNQIQSESVIKWELRNIYYAQKLYFQKHHRYARKVAGLKDAGLKLSELNCKPNINVGKTALLYL